MCVYEVTRNAGTGDIDCFIGDRLGLQDRSVIFLHIAHSEYDFSGDIHEHQGVTEVTRLWHHGQ